MKAAPESDARSQSASARTGQAPAGAARYGEAAHAAVLVMLPYGELDPGRGEADMLGVEVDQGSAAEAGGRGQQQRAVAQPARSPGQAAAMRTS